MSIHKLKRIAQLGHLSEYSIEELFTSFGLYQQAIISTKDVRIEECEEGQSVLVSLDVSRLNEFLCAEKTIMLPCSECGQNIPFRAKKWGNPLFLEETTPEYKKTQKTMKVPLMNPFMGDIQGSHKQNVFEISSPNFRIGNNILNKWNIGDEENSKKQEVWKTYVDRCIQQCKESLIKYTGEVRRDFYCTYQSHRAFVNFRIYDPLEPEDYSEYGELFSSEKEEDKKACAAFEYLSDCVVIQKVGQYPSIADMQFFDVAKYRKILGKNRYSDFTKAIGLYADGIGCGAFLYLRRILEGLIEEKHLECKESESANWNEDEYQRLKVNEKIDLLENRGLVIFPAELNQVKDKLYGVLSKGVHENTDDACAELFPWVKYAIEEVLDEQLKTKERKEKIKELQNKLGQVGS